MSGRCPVSDTIDAIMTSIVREETIFDLPDLPRWRVLIVRMDPAGHDVFLCKVERQKKNGHWVTTVSGLQTYSDGLMAFAGAAAALQKVRENPRKVRAGLVRPFSATP